MFRLNAVRTAFARPQVRFTSAGIPSGDGTAAPGAGGASNAETSKTPKFSPAAEIPNRDQETSDAANGKKSKSSPTPQASTYGEKSPSDSRKPGEGYNKDDGKTNVNKK